MKRLKLIRFIRECGCVLDREGKNHSVFRNPNNGLRSTIARHSEINDVMANVICNQLGIPKIKK
ncbi:MAG: type II toxin-antitoxin system HicA family toxin [Tannerella sp.]|jgi:mRNA interferase HicA|nr:type II toxin-antitoxin system HicA family toxin [Tannerella sp.]